MKTMTYLEDVVTPLKGQQSVEDNVTMTITLANNKCNHEREHIDQLLEIEPLKEHCAQETAKSTDYMLTNAQDNKHKLLNYNTEEKRNDKFRNEMHKLSELNTHTNRSHRLRNAFHNRHYRNSREPHRHDYHHLGNEESEIVLDKENIQQHQISEEQQNEHVIDLLNKKGKTFATENNEIDVINGNNINNNNKNICNSVSSNDGSSSLLSRMKETEKEFDHKMYHINHLLNSAGMQITKRDDVIESLQQEIKRLREQLHEASAPVAAMQHELLDTTSQLMKQVKHERKRCAKTKSHSAQSHAKLIARITELEKQHETDENIKQSLERKVEVAENKLLEAEKSHMVELVNARRSYELQIRTLNKHFKEMMEINKEPISNVREIAERSNKAVSKQVNNNNNIIKKGTKIDTEAESLSSSPAVTTPITTSTLKPARANEKLFCECQCKHIESHHAENSEFIHEQRKNATLKAENDVLRLSISRLLHLMSCVPALSECLKWNELSNEFVFVGYPVHYYPQFTTGTDIISWQREDCVNVNAKCTTGVDGGVYGGVVMGDKSKNVMLNGKWVEQLEAIINDENTYTKLKKIKLFEMEEVANSVNGLPLASELRSSFSVHNTNNNNCNNNNNNNNTATTQQTKLMQLTDLLECRSAEKDYWIPFEVFTLAQAFKNKHFIRLPALTHFYPFLIKLNQIWNAKLAKRLRLHKEKTKALKEMQIGNKVGRIGESRWHFKHFPSNAGVQKWNNTESIYKCYKNAEMNKPSNKDNYMDYVNNEREMPRSDQLQKCSCNYSTFTEFTSVINEFVRFIAQEHYTMRRDVRVQVSSQRYLELFRRYDNFVKYITSYLSQLTNYFASIYANAEKCELEEKEQEEEEEDDDDGELVVNRMNDKENKDKVERLSKSNITARHDEVKQNNITSPTKSSVSFSSEESDEEVSVLIATSAEKEKTIETLLDVIEFCCGDVDNVNTNLTNRVMWISCDMELLMQKLYAYLQYDNAVEEAKKYSNATREFTIDDNRSSSSSEYFNKNVKENMLEEKQIASLSSNDVNHKTGNYENEKIARTKNMCKSSLKVIESAIDFNKEIIEVVQATHAKLTEITSYAMHIAETLERYLYCQKYY